MYFQDDFWEAIKVLPEKDRKDAAMALLEYHFEGCTDETNPVAVAILTVSKKRIELSKTRSNAKKGKTKSSSKQNQTQIKTDSNDDQTQTSPSISLSISPSNSSSASNLKKDDDVEWDNPTSADAEFVASALEVFNDEAEADVANIDYATQCSLAEIRARGRTVDDLRSVVRCKVSQWSGDGKMNRYIRPSTLYSRDHFEEYLAEAKRKTSTNESGVKWDAELVGYADAL